MFENNLIYITYAERHLKIKQPSKFIESQALTQHFCWTQLKEWEQWCLPNF